MEFTTLLLVVNKLLTNVIRSECGKNKNKIGLSKEMISQREIQLREIRKNQDIMPLYTEVSAPQMRQGIKHLMIEILRHKLYPQTFQIKRNVTLKKSKDHTLTISHQLLSRLNKMSWNNWKIQLENLTLLQVLMEPNCI